MRASSVTTRLTILETNKVFMVTFLISLISLLPLVIPVMYLDGHPVYMTGYEDKGKVHVYIDILDRYHIAYLPMLMVSIGLLVLSVIGLRQPQFIALDYIFLFLIAYTASTIPVMKILSIQLTPTITEAVSGVMVRLTIKNITYTWMYYLLKYPILFTIGIFLSVACGVYITLSREQGP
jgi:hypothetical protein